MLPYVVPFSCVWLRVVHMEVRPPPRRRARPTAPSPCTRLARAPTPTPTMTPQLLPSLYLRALNGCIVGLGVAERAGPVPLAPGREQAPALPRFLARNPVAPAVHCIGLGACVCVCARAQWWRRGLLLHRRRRRHPRAD